MNSEPITVHIIANAHLDPVWLWQWQAGLDEIMSTCNTMCDLLDEYPDAIFTAGEAWRYREIEQIDPKLLARIKAHVAAGRWALVGGWWIQPDCNFPSGFGMEKQISTGKEYFQKEFGCFPEVAYNVDSFGHAATLPTLMHAAGQKYYVMMRPQEHEMTLPARYFRWRERAGLPEALTFRIAGAYATWSINCLPEHIKNALNHIPEGFKHTMCFVGVGDHGGGPSVQLIEWVRENAEKLPGCRLVFSSPERFFKAIEKDAARLPEVVGELQYHAIGCYSVMRSFKAHLRRAEHLLKQAEIIAPESPAIKEAWRTIAFNHFHDILGGTSVPSSYLQQEEQLGAATSAADIALQHALRQRMVSLPNDPMQRIVLWNPSESSFDGHIEHEPYLRNPMLLENNWSKGKCLRDEAGDPVPYQSMQSETVNAGWVTRLIFPASLQPGELKTFKLDCSSNDATQSRITVSPNSAINDSGTGVDFSATEGLILNKDLKLPLPRLDLIDDLTDNWTHVIDRYPEGPVVASPNWSAPAVIDAGPIMGSLMRTGRIGDSEVNEEWRVYAGKPWVELLLTINWRERRRLLKLTLATPQGGQSRLDGIMGGSLERPNSGRECPLQDWSLLPVGGEKLAIVSPSLFAIDATPWRVRSTMLRSPVLTQHEPVQQVLARAVYADHGIHHFRILFGAGGNLDAEKLATKALMLHRPPLGADTTKGMPRANA